MDQLLSCLLILIILSLIIAIPGFLIALYDTWSDSTLKAELQAFRRSRKAKRQKSANDYPRVD